MSVNSVYTHRIIVSVSFIVAVIALILTSVWTSNQNTTNNNVNRNLENLTNDVNHLQMEYSMTQSKMVEILMSSSANETIIQEGTFVWSIGGRSYSYPGGGCSDVVPTGFAIDVAGTGYRIDDLITVSSLSFSGFFYNSPVLKVVSVGSLGEVLSFNTLTPGCLSSNPFGNSSFITLSVLGIGFTVKLYAPPYPPININTYPVFQTPQDDPVAPLQYANYSLRRITIESVEYTLLYLSPPEFPIITQPFYPTLTTLALTVALYEFEPAVPALQVLGYYGYIFPLTKKNLGAINLTEDGNCFNTNPDCWLDVSGDTSRVYPNAVRFYHNIGGANQQISNAYILWHFNSNAAFYDYMLQNAVLQLNYPLVFVLPSL